MKLFQNRADAGHQLAQKLKHYSTEKPIILALPRGGVPVAYEIAEALKAPLEVLIVRKIGLPWNPELGVGAVAPGVRILDKKMLYQFGVTTAEIEKIIAKEQQEVERRQELYQQHDDLQKITGKTVILVDDGVATGVTVRAAIQAVKHLTPSKIILAIPVGAAETIQQLSLLVNDLICLEVPSFFQAVGAFYSSFPQVADDEVMRLLTLAKEKRKKDDPPPSKS